MSNKDSKSTYTESPENDKRRIEISEKLIKMGEALIVEGKGNDDYCVLSSGNILMLMSELIINPKGIDEFNHLCALHTAKSIVDKMMDGPFGGLLMNYSSGPLGDDIIDYLKGKDIDDETED